MTNRELTGCPFLLLATQGAINEQILRSAGQQTSTCAPGAPQCAGARLGML